LTKPGSWKNTRISSAKNDSEDPELHTKVAELKKKLQGLEEQAPWLTFDYPLEILLWGPPHG
jgi:hypothetical protein